MREKRASARPVGPAGAVFNLPNMGVSIPYLGMSNADRPGSTLSGAEWRRLAATVGRVLGYM